MESVRNWLAWGIANFAINRIAAKTYRRQLTEVIARGFEEYKRERGY